MVCGGGVRFGEHRLSETIGIRPAKRVGVVGALRVDDGPKQIGIQPQVLRKVAETVIPGGWGDGPSGDGGGPAQEAEQQACTEDHVTHSECLVGEETLGTGCTRRWASRHALSGSPGNGAVRRVFVSVVERVAWAESVDGW